MMPNRYRGETLLEIGGQERVLRFTWDAIAKLRGAHGEDFDKLIIMAVDSKDVTFLAEVIAAATGMEPAEVMAGSPPLVLAGRAIVEALRHSYHGQEGKPENPLEARRPATWWKWLMRRLSGLV